MFYNIVLLSAMYQHDLAIGMCEMSSVSKPEINFEWGSILPYSMAIVEYRPEDTSIACCLLLHALNSP